MLWVILSTIGLFLGLGILVWIHRQYRMSIVVQPVPPPPDAPLISVIIPARDEARNIRACVQALLAQEYPNLEVIVVDDRSQDATPQILNELQRDQPHLRVIQGSPLPAGWAGKPHALWQGAQLAAGDWLCFLDADTFASPQLIASTLTTARAARADLFTILTSQELASFWEKVVLPLVFTGLSVGFAPERVNDPHRSDAIANGQFLLFRREVYKAIGGHAAVRNSIVEDRDIANRTKKLGYRLVVADGRQVARTRMYTSFAEIWEGWTKNIYLGLRGEPRLVALGFLAAFLSLVVTIGLPAWLVLGTLWLAGGGGWMAGVLLGQGILLAAAMIGIRAVVDRSMGISPWYALTTPLGMAVFAAMMAASTYNVISGKGVRWKGRVYKEG